MGISQRLTGVASSPVRDLLALTMRPEVISFAGGLPSAELFDLAGWQAAFNQALSESNGRRNLQYAPTEGNQALRTAVASRMSGRGLATDADSLLITTGSQQALTLVAAALLDPGAVVAVEEPTYLAALQCFAMANARVVPVAGDEQGLDPDALKRVIERERPALLYLVPTFANPTGHTLTAERRMAIAEIAVEHGIWVVEDDPYGELRYRGTAVPPLSAIPHLSERAIYLGSFSKIGTPGLRLGWVRSPAALRSALVIVKQAADLHTSTIDQAAAAEYLAHADLDGHIKNLCLAYRLRRDAMISALPSVTPPGTQWSDPDGGMFVWVRLPGNVDTASLLPRALEQDVAFVPGAPFFSDTPDPATLRLSFTTYSPEDITEGMNRLGSALLS